MNARTSRVSHRAAKVVGIVSGSIATAAGVLLVVVLGAGGIFAPADYLEPWAEDYAEKLDDPRMRLVAHAILAPSSHNEQPWTVTLDEADENVMYVYADPSRLTPEVDPLARQTMISQGTFLEYLRVAGAKVGTGVSIELFPEGEYDEGDLSESMSRLPVAKVALTSGTATADVDYASMFRSDTNRSPYAATEVTVAQADELAGLATSGSSVALYREPDDVAAIGDATVRGSIIESQNSAVAAESADVFRSNEYSKNEARSGFAVEGQGTTGFMKYLLQGLATLLPATNSPAVSAQRDVALATDGAAHTPAYAGVDTAGNSRTEQVDAGMLYAKLSLRARSLGLVVQPVSQVLEEYSSMEKERAAIHEAYAPGGSTIQMLVRVGTATVEYPPTMRRDADDFVAGQE
ncbi:Acg family FMN-binding oxidoreductase [Microbacterium sp. P07]|uniref:Acg family FMN-binding oxidoreductase n=1 Tax=Microbacterium sp. P07 TaxID=3366952 RepID=UPI0037468651